MSRRPTCSSIALWYGKVVAAVLLGWIGLSAYAWIESLVRRHGAMVLNLIGGG